MAQHETRNRDSEYFPFGFPVQRRAWEAYRLSELDYPATDDPAAEVKTIRQVAERINQRRPGQTVYAGELMGMSVLVDVLRFLIERYCEFYADVVERGLDCARERTGADIVDEALETFVHLFPPASVQLGRENEAHYLEGHTQGRPNRHRAVEEELLVSLATDNPALKPFSELFDDADLRNESPYPVLVETLETFIERQPVFAPLSKHLFELLRAPSRAHPTSLDGQLAYVKQHWGAILPERLLRRLLLAQDLMREETRMRALGPGEPAVLRFGIGLGRGGDYPERERFSMDKDWMSNVVLIAKSVYVWLEQLSRTYQRAITRLDQIPDEELDRLGRWGFTGLWLIGVWERSPASQRIKQLRGNPEAMASAYSIYEYEVAGDLGGDPALRNLRDRAWQRGIRLASDMVPNHMGVYSKWVIEHPHWFIQLDHPPYPAYRFTGENLSHDPRVAIQIEDGYWDHRDAAVVFKRTDTWTGDVRYIYHGNDGTSMPWNDTAQLNYLLPEVREAVIQTILHVARQFPIIRFDAAMTLARKHYQRLWFPTPGTGGAIPSRAEHGLTREEFDRLFPQEFWRDVVDRVAREAPDTLLLAEAFWLMEGYFVRTLGMHRVYNSAFMNMLKMEDNAKYRTTLKNVLEFSPAVLQRFVNFMNNPDEQTAVEQFGKEDKYYGIAVLMVTMPGLPMFGHGQIEGFTEKYGMEYRKAYWHESPDEHMVRRHETEIFSLMRKRHLFSGAGDFVLYDYWSTGGGVDENVFAYSNRGWGDRALVLYNNAYNTTAGWVRLSTAVNVGSAEKPALVRKSIAEALELNTDPRCYYVLREHRSGLEYLRHAKALAEDGLYAELCAYGYCVFLDWREWTDTDGSIGRLDGKLAGRGVPNMEKAYKELVALAPFLEPFREFLSADRLRRWENAAEPAREVMPELDQALRAFLPALKHVASAPYDEEGLHETILACVDAAERLTRNPAMLETLTRVPMPPALLQPRPTFRRIVFVWALVAPLGQAHAVAVNGPSGPAGSQAAANWPADWMLEKPIAGLFEQVGADLWRAETDARLVAIMAAYVFVLDAGDQQPLAAAVRPMMQDPAVAEFLQANHYQGVLWINKEQLEALIHGLLLASLIVIETQRAEDKSARQEMILERALTVLTAAERAGYNLDKMLEFLE